MARKVFELRIPGGWAGDFLRYAKKLTKGRQLQAINKKGVHKLALEAAKAVRRGYAAADYGHTQGTLEAYAFGKKQGKGRKDGSGGKPARRKYPSASSLNRSGTLKDSVVVRAMRNKGRKVGGYDVQIDPKKVYGAKADKADKGILVSRIAAQMENPRPIMVTLTPAMAAYLALIKGKDKDKQRTGSKKVGDVITITQKPRPVWEPVFYKLRTIMPAYSREVAKLLQKAMQTGFSIKAPK